MSSKPNHALEFLPAALELQETPPSPVGRAIGWSIVLFFCIAVTWAFVGEVDIVSVAHGKIVSSGRVKVVQPLETSMVKRILVQEGQSVEAGEVLVELDTTIATADRARLSGEWLAAQLEAGRIDALLIAITTPEAAPAIRAVPGATSRQLSLQQSRIDTSYAEYLAGISSSDQEVQGQRAELKTTRARIALLTATIPLVSEQAMSVKQLADQNLAPRGQWLQLERERIEQVHQKTIHTDQLAVIEAHVARLEARRAGYEAQFKTRLLSELAEVEIKIAVLEQELVKASKRQTFQHLTSPTSGVVQQLAIHTVGGVVTPAQELMLIVPSNETLLAEAWVENKDIGFVNEKQIAEVKVDAFPFTKYGTIDAQIANLSNDAVPNEKLGLAYAAQVTLERAAINVDGKEVNLSPGMSVTVEIKIGKRRLIEFLMSPLLRGVKESARER